MKKQSATRRPRAVPRWKAYQQKVARLFKALGCIVEGDAVVQGVRARHKIDVWVRLARCGVQVAWVIECKLWNRRVSKEKVLALRALVEDVGADRGVLIAEGGHQHAALDAARSANIVLTTLEALSQSAKADLLHISLHGIFSRTAQLSREAMLLYGTEHSVQKITSRPKPGVDGRVVFEAFSRIAVLETGIKNAQLGAFPALLAYGPDRRTPINAGTLEEFIQAASRILDDCATIISRQTKRVAWRRRTTG